MVTQLQAATEILRQLRASGFQAYFVGGCVRDLVMGITPKDYDIVTSAHPEQVSSIFGEAIAVGAKFGVMLVPRPAGNVEVATFRSDGIYADGRHPQQVTYSASAQEDVTRRDFTINGLLYDPESARVLDYVEGQQDIRAGILRTIGEPRQRFGEDYLRMMRAVRFAARFNFALHPATFHALRELAQNITQVSHERVRDELLKILTEGGAHRGLELLDQTGLLQWVLPEVKAMQGVAQPPQFHPEGDVWVHTLLMLQLMQHPSESLALGVLLHDVGKPPTFTLRDRIRFDGHVEVGAKMAGAICRRLHLPLRVADQVVRLVEQHMRFKDFPRMRLSTQLRFIRQEGFTEHLELHRLDCLASHGDLSNYHLACNLLAEVPAPQRAPQRLLNGNDLINLGYTPGAQFKLMLQAVEDAQLEGRLVSREQALSFVRNEFPLPPSPPQPCK